MLDELDDEALDALPYGVVCLSSAGKVLRMNRAECERAGIQRWRALGRDYAREIAPAAKAHERTDTLDVVRERVRDRIYVIRRAS